MSEHYFSQLTERAIKFDAESRDLSETLRYPHKVLEGHGADDDKARSELQVINSQIEELKNDMADDAKSRADFMAESDAFLVGMNQELADLQQSFHDLQTVFSEYGYASLEHEKAQNVSDGIISSTNSSLISSTINDDLEVEFTPDMKWRRKAK